MNPTLPAHFETYLRVVHSAGSIGVNLPPNLPGFTLTGEQLNRVNRTYDEARNAHRARTLKGRAS